MNASNDFLSATLFRRRRYGGFVVTQNPVNNQDMLKLTKKPTRSPSNISSRELSAFDIQQKNQTRTYNDDIKSKRSYPTVFQTNKPSNYVMPKDVVNVEVDRQNLSITYTTKDGQSFTKQGGHKAWRTNNPGNLSFSSLEEARKTGAVGIWEDSEGHKFGIYESQEAGYRALSNKLDERRFSYYKDGSKRNIERMMLEIYAPLSDNNNTYDYINFIRQSGIDTHKSVEELTPEEKQRLMRAIATHEGNKAGQLIAKN